MARYSGANPNKTSGIFPKPGSGSGSGRGSKIGKKYPPAPPKFDFQEYEADKNAQFIEEQQAKIARRKQEEANETQSTRGYAFTVNGQIVGEAQYLQGGSSGIGAGIKPPLENIQGIPGAPIESGPKPISEPERPSLEEEILQIQERPEDPSEVASKSPLIISNLTKEVFDKSSFDETLDLSFTQLGPENQLDPSFFDISLATLEDFWTLYDQFFYDIPKTGPNSHETLAQTSGEYANYELIQQQIQALLDEIAEIREENVELRLENVNLTVSGSIAEGEAAQLQAQIDAQTT